MITPGRLTEIKFKPQIVDVNNFNGWFPTGDTTTNYGFIISFHLSYSILDQFAANTRI